jgi:hypothetical protein
MRIIDKRKDYYDSAQAYGTDPSIMYVRETTEIKDKKSWGGRGGDAYFVVGFCGNIYYGYRYYIPSSYSYDPKIPAKSRSVEEQYYSCYSLDDAEAFYQEHRKDKLDEFNGLLPANKWTRRSRWRKSPKESLAAWFEGSIYKTWTGEEEKVQYSHDYFTEHNSPIWVHDRTNYVLYINPLLRPWDFFRVKDAYTAYNEISNYVGGVLQHPMKPIPTPSDETKIELAGFDPTTSFRKPKK